MRAPLRVFGFLVSSLAAASGNATTPDEQQLSIAIHKSIETAQQDLSALKCEDFGTSSQELSINDALLVALKCNPVAKARLAEVPVSRAEMEQLGLIESPQIEFGALFPIKSPNAAIGLDGSATFNLTDVMQLSARKKMASASFSQKKWETVSELLRIVTDVKIAIYQYQTLNQLQAFWKDNLSVAQATEGLARAQRKAGNISELEEAQHIAFAKMVVLELAKIDNELRQARLALVRLLGFAGQEVPFQIAAKLPLLPKTLPDLESLKALAKEQRPDILARKQKLLSHHHELEVAKLGLFPRLDLGFHIDRDPEGNLGMGPVIQIQLPFLGHQSVAVAKAKAEINVSQQSLQALETNTPNELEGLYQQMVQANQIVRLYDNEILPLQDKIMKESLKQYNFMLLGNYQLFLFRQNQINARKDAILARRDYWIAYAELENLLGAPISHADTPNA